MLNKFECDVKLVTATGNANNRGIHMVFQQNNSKYIFQLELRETRETAMGKIYSPTSFTIYTGDLHSLNRKLGGKLLPINIESLWSFDTKNISKKQIFDDIKTYLEFQNEVAVLK